MKIEFVFPLVAFLEITFADDWHDFKKQHDKDYKNHNEENYRMKLFKTRNLKINEHNKNYEAGTVSYKLGVNWFTDRTENEIKRYTHGLIIPKNYSNNINFNHNVMKRSLSIPGAINFPVNDWRMQGAVSPIKNQFQCDSCWAFASTGAIESHIYIYRQRYVLLSEQNLVDCVTKNIGCKGGWPTYAMQYVQSNGGIDSESSYPYEAVDGRCRYTPQSNSAQVLGVVELPRYSENALFNAVAYRGPVTVCFDATGDFVSYRSGIYSNVNCNPERLTHAVLAIGYGTENGRDYWLCKNSWGPTWGENGFFRIARNADNMCGIATVTSYPLV